MAGTGDDEIPIVHVWGEQCRATPTTYMSSCLQTGTPYEMGYAHGSLMKEKAKGLINDVWAYMELQVVGFIVPVTVC